MQIINAETMYLVARPRKPSSDQKVLDSCGVRLVVVRQVTTDPRHDLCAVIEMAIRFFEVQENPDLEACDGNGFHNGEGLRLSVGQGLNFSPGSGKTFVMVLIKDAKNSARA